MRVRVLGELQVLGATGWETPSSALRRRTLSCLALAPGVVVPPGRIAEALWGDDAPVTAPKVVQNHVAGLRRVFGAGMVTTSPGGYSLTVREPATDAVVFESLVQAGRDGLQREDTSGALAMLDEGLALWRGEPFLDLVDWAPALGEVARLQELREEAVEHRLDALIASDRVEEAIPALEAAVFEAPLRERRWELLMVALYRTGRQADALAAYDRARRNLRDELGIDPGPTMSALQRAVLTQDAALDAAVRPGTSPPRHALAMARRGEAERLAGDPRHLATLHEAARLALEAGDDEALLAALLGGLRRTSPRVPAGVDLELISLLESAIERARSDDTRARLLAALGQELAFLPDLTRARSASDAAMAFARPTGDAALISEVLARRPIAYGGPDLLSERLETTAENLRLVAHVEDPMARWGAWYGRIAAAMEAGRIDEVEIGVVQLRAATEAAGAAPSRWGLLITEAWLHLLRGELIAAERTALSAFEYGVAHAQPDALGIYSGQLLNIRREQGRLLELEELLRAALAQPPMGPTSRPLIAEALADMGLHQLPTELLRDELESSIELAPRQHWLTVVCAWSTVAFRLRDRAAARRLRVLLAPHLELVVFNNAFVAGAAALFDGMLALVLADEAGASASLEMALRIHESIRAPLLAARTRALLPCG